MARTSRPERAIQARQMRYQLRLKIKAGEVDWYEVIVGNEPEWERYVAGIRFDRMLLMIPGVGEQTMWELCLKFDVRPDMRMSALTFARRQELADLTRAALTGEPTPVRPGLAG